jgi:hypothetical protein
MQSRFGCADHEGPAGQVRRFVSRDRKSPKQSRLDCLADRAKERSSARRAVSAQRTCPCAGGAQTRIAGIAWKTARVVDRPAVPNAGARRRLRGAAGRGGCLGQTSGCGGLQEWADERTLLLQLVRPGVWSEAQRDGRKWRKSNNARALSASSLA